MKTIARRAALQRALVMPAQRNFGIMQDYRTFQHPVPFLSVMRLIQVQHGLQKSKIGLPSKVSIAFWRNRNLIQGWLQLFSREATRRRVFLIRLVLI